MNQDTQSTYPYPIAQHLRSHSQLIYGCMGLGGGWNENPIAKADIKQAQAVIETCLEHNINIFDHADIYTFGKAEQVFGEVLKQMPSLREQMSIQSKCGIRFADECGVKRYDFSATWINHSVDQILSRLHIEQLDVLMLHRPDPLTDMEELVKTLSALHQSGKVKYIGMSNMHVSQLKYFQSLLPLPIICNQIELSLGSLGAINDSIEPSHHYDGLFEYSQTQNIQIQAWGALFQGQFTKEITDDTPMNVRHTASLINDLAQKYSVSKEAIVLAFLTRLPVAIQPIIGTTNLERITHCAQVNKCLLSHTDWYALLESARNHDVP